MVQLTDDLTNRLDREATRRHCSRSAVIREALVEYLERLSIASKVEQYVASYTAEPPGEPDLWGETTRRGPAFASLDAEAEALGLPW
jgi:Arc/MetJ-type ribon-helix-helix transcriptional regulator